MQTAISCWLRAWSVRVRQAVWRTRTQYTVALGSRRRLKVWGFGIYCGADTGCYVGRFDFIPRLATAEDEWAPRRLASGHRTDQLQALLPAMRWISTYEANITQRLGPEYRRNAAAGGPAEAGTALTLATLWLHLLTDVARFASNPRTKAS